MSARIAPEPVGLEFGAPADYRSRQPRVEPAADSALATSAGQAQNATTSASSDRPDPAKEPLPNLPDLPAPAAPPGEAFATALISGQLPPRPTSEAEVQLRLGSAKAPAQGSLPLTDRLV